jgi:hypothetical protein
VEPWVAYHAVDDRLREEHGWLPEASAYSTHPENQQGRGELEFALLNHLEPVGDSGRREWWADVDTQLTRGTRWDGHVLTTILERRRYRKISTYGGREFYEREVRRFDSALVELRWVVANAATTRGATVVRPPGPFRTGLQKYWGVVDAARSAGMKQYSGPYERRFVRRVAAIRCALFHRLRTDPSWMSGYLPQETVEATLTVPTKEALGGADVKRLAVEIRVALDAIGFRGCWEYSAENLRWGASFHAPLRPVRAYTAVRSPFFDVAPRLESMLASLGR